VPENRRVSGQAPVRVRKLYLQAITGPSGSVQIPSVFTTPAPLIANNCQEHVPALKQTLLQANFTAIAELVSPPIYSMRRMVLGRHAHNPELGEGVQLARIRYPLAKRVIMAALLNKFHSAVWICAVLLALLALQQAPFLIRGDYSRRLVWERTSPDQHYRLEVRRQATFPALHDPSGMAYFAVMDTRTGRPGARTIVPLHQVFGFKRPQVRWTDEDVQVVNFEQSQQAAVRLLLAH